MRMSLSAKQGDGMLRGGTRLEALDSQLRVTILCAPLSPPLVPSPPMKHGQKSEALPGKEGVSSKSTAGFWCEELCPRNMVMTVVGCTAGGRAARHLSGTGAATVWVGHAAACFQTLLRCQEEGL